MQENKRGALGSQRSEDDWAPAAWLDTVYKGD
jgi:hypothetical protein